jgi:cytochrome c biogenesis protein
MTEVTAKKELTGRSVIDIAVDRVWRFFCSTRAAIYEIAIVALLVLIGTLHNSQVPEWIADHISGTVWIVRRWYAWDVFHSFVFIVMLAILAVAVFIGGMVNRAPGIWRTIRHPTIRTTQGFLSSTETSAFVTAAETPDQLTADLRAMLKKKRYRFMTEKVGDDVHIYADKNAYAKLGTFPFHIALILMIAGGIINAQWGFREMEFIVPEGSVREVGHGTNLSVGLTQFTDTYSEDGQPHEYRSDLVIYDGDQQVKSGSIVVNEPIGYNNATIYQSGFGQAVQMRVTDASGNVLFDDSIPIGIYRSTLNPDAPAGIVELKGLNASLYVIAPDDNPANMPQLDTLNLKSGQMFVQIRDNAGSNGQMPPSQVIEQGQPIELAGLNIDFVRERRFTVLQVAYNPGIPVFIVASILLVGGAAWIFYFAHRRMRAIISPTENGSEAHLAPMAKRDWTGKRDFERLMDEWRNRSGFTVEMRENDAKSIAPDTTPETATPA